MTMIEKPRDWDRAIKRIMKSPGTTIIIGAPDTGKTTFAGALIEELRSFGVAPHMIDADLGQKTIGPPGTIGRRFISANRKNPEETELYFIGDTTPNGHIIEMITGMIRLAKKSRGIEPAIIDTAGFISGAAGLSLQYHAVTALEPQYLVFLRRAQELNLLISACSFLKNIKSFVLDTPTMARRISVQERALNRAKAFRDYFENSSEVEIRISDISVFPPNPASLGRREVRNMLIGLLDSENNTIGMGMVIGQTRFSKTIRIMTPVRRFDEVACLKLGYLRIAADGTELGRIGRSR